MVWTGVTMLELPSTQDEDGAPTCTSRVAYFRQPYGSNQKGNSGHGIEESTATQNYNIGLATLGESNNTCCAYEAAIKCFDAYANCSEDVAPLAHITSKMIENDNLKVLFLKFAVYLGNTDIPSQRGGNLIIASKMNYSSKIKELLMKKFPNHPAWADASTDKTSWWSQLHCRAEKAMKCNDRSDVLQTRPLYQNTKNSPEWYPVDKRDSNKQFPQDPHSIMGTLFEESTSLREYNNSAGPMQNRVKAIMDFQAAGHGGEIKFLCWNETWWDPFLKTPQLI